MRSQPIQVVTNCYTAEEATELCSREGARKANARIDKIFFSAFTAGCILAFACAGVLSANTAPWYQSNAPGLIQTLGALIFPWGLCSIVLSGAHLVTASFMYTTVAALHRRISVWKMLTHWVVAFLGNLAGSLFIVGLITGYGGTFDLTAYKAEVYAYNKKKVVIPEWHMVFLRGVGANWLVCLSCFLAMMGREVVSKIFAIWWPTFAFVSLGFDHLVANMYFVPTSIFLGDPEINVGYYIWKSMIPTLLGNIVGGGLLVGVVYWYLYLLKQEPIAIDGELYENHDSPLIGQEADDDRSPERSGSEHKSAEAMV